MLQITLLTLAGLLALGGLLFLVMLVSFRTSFRPVQTALRRMNRRFLNPRQLRTAGGPGAYASIVHHVGRRSGAAYRTPVVPVATADRLVVGLPYGPGADWVQNVLAAGRATIDHDGHTVAVTTPRLMAQAEAAPLFPPGERRSHRLYGVCDFLALTIANATNAQGDGKVTPAG